MPTRNINLTDHLDALIESNITSGRYKNASEVVREGLRLLEQRQQEDMAKLERLRAEARRGFDALDSGDYVEIRDETDLDAVMAGIRGQVTKGVNRARGSVDV